MNESHGEQREVRRETTSIHLLDSTELNKNLISTGCMQNESKSVHELTKLVVGG